MKKLGLLVPLLWLGPAAWAQPVLLTDAFPNLSFSNITDIQHPGDGTDRLFVVQKGGVIEVFNNEPGSTTTETFLSLSVATAGEMGLLGLAFHPNYATNGLFYVYYNLASPRRTIISQFSVSSGDPNQADAGSEVRLMEFANNPHDDENNHKGGAIRFGPGGYLYIALGDGGGQNDPDEYGQNTSVLLGSILRIDVDADPSGTAPDCGALTLADNYTIPDNPLADGAGTGACDEIFLYGFRNPWRISFDAADRLWVGDVGQGAREEIDLIDVNQVTAANANYGWDVMEGTLCHEPSSGCNTTGLQLPLIDYRHHTPEGGESITGGYVYTGSSCTPLTGQYIYADFITGHIWSLSEGAPVDTTRLVQSSGLSISTFGVDAAGELYLGDYFGGSLYTLNCTALPIELATFEASVDGSDVVLTWQTSSEQDNAGFFAMRTSDFGLRNDSSPNPQSPISNPQWEPVGWIEGQGTTLAPSAYRHRVSGLEPGRHRFRLKQVDFDGSFSYSPVVEAVLEMPGAYVLSRPYPNPFNPETQVVLSVREAQEVRVEVLDGLGRVVTTLHRGPVEAQRSYRFRVQGASLPSGAYWIRATGKSFTAVEQAVLLK